LAYSEILTFGIFGEMEEKEVNISARGLKNITKLRIEKDFTFIVGEHHDNCSCFIAEFLSPRISHLRSNDVTMKELVIETEDPEMLFESILSIGFGSTLCVKEETFSFFVSIARELCNWELYFGLHSVFNKDLNISTFCREFGDCEMNEDFPDRGIEFVSSHFYEIDSSFLNEFPISILIRILSNSSLQIESEDSLYKMIRCQIESKSSFIESFSFIRFEYLSIDSIKDFISWSCEYFEQFEQFFSIDVWTAICNRLCSSVYVKMQNQNHDSRYCYKSIHFVPQSDRPLCGIISYLTSEHCGMFRTTEL
jgi:hypothetical protein